MEPLTPSELQHIFDTEIRPDYFPDRLAATEQPTAIFLGGQPGAGKSQAITRFAREHPDVVPLSGDDLRSFDPRYAQLVRERPLDAGPILAASTSVWVRNAIDYAAQHNRSLLLEGTFHTPRVTLDTVERFSRAGFRTQIVALATPRRDSLTSAASRYYRNHEAGEEARWTPLDQHDRGWRGTRDLLPQITRDSGVDRVTIMTRDDTIYDAPVDEYNPAEAVEALDRGRNPPPTNASSLMWLSELRAYTDYAIHTGQITRESAPVLVELHTIAVKEVAPSLRLPENPEARERLLDRLSTTRSLIQQTANQSPVRTPDHLGVIIQHPASARRIRAASRRIIDPLGVGDLRA